MRKEITALLLLFPAAPSAFACDFKAMDSCQQMYREQRNARDQELAELRASDETLVRRRNENQAEREGLLHKTSVTEINTRLLKEEQKFLALAAKAPAPALPGGSVPAARFAFYLRPDGAWGERLPHLRRERVKQALASLTDEAARDADLGARNARRGKEIESELQKNELARGKVQLHRDIAERKFSRECMGSYCPHGPNPIHRHEFN